MKPTVLQAHVKSLGTSCEARPGPCHQRAFRMYRVGRWLVYLCPICANTLAGLGLNLKRAHIKDW